MCTKRASAHTKTQHTQMIHKFQKPFIFVEFSSSINRITYHLRYLSFIEIEYPENNFSHYTIAFPIRSSSSSSSIFIIRATTMCSFHCNLIKWIYVREHSFWSQSFKWKNTEREKKKYINVEYVKEINNLALSWTIFRFIQ